VLHDERRAPAHRTSRRVCLSPLRRLRAPRATTVVAAHSASRIVLIGQAPGRAVHESGVPWDDRSGDYLRARLGISRERFYDRTAVSIIPMGFCFPGTESHGDIAPRAECAPQWHGRLFPLLRSLKLTIYLGHYALKRILVPDTRA